MNTYFSPIFEVAKATSTKGVDVGRPQLPSKLKKGEIRIDLKLTMQGAIEPPYTAAPVGYTLIKNNKIKYLKASRVHSKVTTRRWGAACLTN